MGEQDVFEKLKKEEIEHARQQGLAISCCEDEAYNWLQVKEIRKGLEAGVDTSAYQPPGIPWEKMREIRRGMKIGINLKPYLAFDEGVLRQIRKAKEANVNIIPYIKAGYQAEQLEKIIGTLEKGLDIEPYLTKRFLGVAIREICRGLEEGIDVSLYADPKYNWQQMREIRLGLERHLDVSSYASRFFDARQMQEIRTGLEEGIDVREYAKFMYTATDMKRIRENAGRRTEQEAAEAAAKRQTQSMEQAEELLSEGSRQQMELVGISVSSDEMEAYIIYDEKLTKMSRADIIKALRRKGIVKGIDEAAITRILSGEVETDKPVLVAQGRPPVKGKDGWYEYFFRTEVARTPKQLEDGSVDYQSVEWFEIVRENQKVVEYHKAQDGVTGYTVKGTLLPALKGKELEILRGSGYRLTDDGNVYIAAMDGRIQLRGTQFVITRMFIFDETTTATGNVDVDGNAYVRGNVGSGTKIKATGDVVIDGFIEGAVIESGANIFLRSGVNASGLGYLRAEGDVAGSFFEAATVWAGGDIRANYSLDSELHAKGRLRLSGEKGSVIGGRADAAKGIAVYKAGNSAGVPTYLHFGVTDEMKRRAQDLEEKIAEINHELEVFRGAYADFYMKYPAEVRNSMELYIKVERAIYTKEKELAELLPEQEKLAEIIKNAGDAVAVIRDTVYEGVQFEANGVTWNARTVSNIRVKRVKNRIAVYPN